MKWLFLSLAWPVGTAAQALDGERVGYEISAGLVQRSLSEWAADGSRLVRESGLVPRFEARRTWRTGSGAAFQMAAGFSQAVLGYDGRTQAGAGAASTSGHDEWEAVLQWRPWAAGRWTDVWLGVHWQRLERAIAPLPAAGGLRETYASTSPQWRWRVALPERVGAWPLPGQPWVEAEWRRSRRQTVAVDFLGLLDNAGFDAGVRRQMTLRLGARPDPDWQWQLGWSRVRQDASAPAPLRSGGVTVGTVQQPRNTLDEFSFSLGRRWP